MGRSGPSPAGPRVQARAETGDCLFVTATRHLDRFSIRDGFFGTLLKLALELNDPLAKMFWVVDLRLLGYLLDALPQALGRLQAEYEYRRLQAMSRRGSYGAGVLMESRPPRAWSLHD